MQDEPSAMGRLATDPSDRKRFLKAVGGTGAAGAFALFLAACGSDNKKSSSSSTSAQQAMPAKKTGTEMFGKGDLGILGYALTLEYLETQFYADAAKSGKLSGKPLAVAKQFGNEESQHVQALEAAIKKLGGKLPAKPKAKFPLKDQNSILKLAATVENLGANAYLGQAGNIENKEVLAAALSIHSVEARHASVLNTVIGMDITPDGAFSKPASADEVLKSVKPFLVS
ncbi:MAG TPA: ferritin-like domain-containing protein [Thermoleophilaceae bacterium]